MARSERCSCAMQRNWPRPAQISSCCRTIPHILPWRATARDFPIPCLHVANVVAAEAAARGYRRIGILGTEWTMTGPVYADALGRARLAWSVPNTPDRTIIHRVIFDELCVGEFKDESRAEFLRIIGKLAKVGCDAVALVCTEIPLLIGPEDSPIPVLDSTRLLARAAVEIAIGERPMPVWRGGPIGAE
jgi:aspartate racemase